MDVKQIHPDIFAAQMARREIVFYRPEPHWQNGLVIGNGDVGASVFCAEQGTGLSLGVTLNKVDVWDERYDRKNHALHTLDELRQLIRENRDTDAGREKLRSLEPYCMIGQGQANEWYKLSYPYAYAPPTPKPVGLVQLELGGRVTRFEQRLSIHRGEVSFSLETETGASQVTIRVDANTNVLVLRLERNDASPSPVALVFSRYHDDQLGEPEVQATPDGFSHRYQFPDGLSYAAYGLVQSAGQITPAEQSETWRDIQARNGWIPGKTGFMVNWDEVIEAPNRGIRLELEPGMREATLYLAFATSRETGDPLAEARALAKRAAASAEPARRDHLAWWDAFWRRSSLQLSDRLVETLWYQGLYVLALQARGGLPPSLIGPGYYLPHAAWNGHFITDFNVEMNCWPIYAANHLELGRPIFDFFSRHLAGMRAETLALYGLDGVKIPGICVGTGRELSYIPCRMWQSSSAWIAQLYWWAYEYSQDIDFLRSAAYPLMREVAIFYRGYAERGEDGRYHIFPSTAPEQGPWWATDPAIDMALIRVHMQAVLRASDMLSVDEDLRPGWQDLLDHLADIPNNGEVILDESSAAPDKRLGHAGLLMAVFSASLIGVRSPRADQELARRTLDNAIAHTSRTVVDYPLEIPTWNDDCNWPYILAVTARLGLGEQTRAYLYDYGILQHLKPNGLFAFDCPINDGQRQTRWGMPDSSHAFTAAVSEMLIQSYDGKINVAPAIPADWDVSFSGFLAVGAFEVEAEIVRGQVRRLGIKSLAGRSCEVVNPWPGRPVQVRAQAAAIAFTVEAGIIRFDTQAGETYALEAEAEDPAGPSPEFEAGPAEPLSYSGPAYLWNIPPERRIQVKLGSRD